MHYFSVVPIIYQSRGIPFFCVCCVFHSYFLTRLSVTLEERELVHLLHQNFPEFPQCSDW